jgi:ABC-type lipopolysaccharide export system ATPase subunit
MFPRLAERQRQPGRTLSGGERQMLALGGALMACPELVLSSMSPRSGCSRAWCVPSSRRSAASTSGITVLLIEQNVHFSPPMSHRAYVLEQGRVVLEGAGRALLDDPHVRLSYLGCDIVTGARTGVGIIVRRRRRRGATTALCDIGIFDGIIVAFAPTLTPGGSKDS